MTQTDLLDMLVMRLIREHGGAKHRWRRSVGNVRVYSQRTHPHCNWAINPTGSGSDVARIEAMVDDLRASHPFVVADR